MKIASRVVVVVFDGLRPDMVTPAHMPHLAAFAADGLWFRQARSVFPSMTRVATSSISTGAPPVVHGIVGNSFYYPEVTRDFVLDTSLAEDIALAESRLSGPLIAAETLGDRLAAHEKSFAVVHSGSAGSTYAINPRVAANGHWTFSVMGREATRTPHAVDEVVERFGPLPPRTLPRFEETDYVTRVFTEHVLGEMDPDVALIWFNEPDTSFHYRLLASAETNAIMSAVDVALARILTAIKRRPDADEIAIIVASDHGQISSSGVADLATLLTEAGHKAARASSRAINGADITVTGGNMGEIRIVDGDMARRDRIARWLMQRDEIGMVFTPSDDPVHGAVEGTFSTALVGLDHPRQPELVYVLRSGTGADAHGLPGLGLITGGVPIGGGMHGGLNRHELNTVLILGGAARGGTPGLSEAPSGIIDIAPTVLGLLGKAVPTSMRGTNLAEIEARRQPASVSTLETGVGAFRQQLSIARRGNQLFLIHGGRLST
ncbi:MAG: alkaline phosphatase family protein [Hyphomicrobiales bacterium]|nr:alkaline phosphatase family protein [Hyphomicrobiales bacterium]